MKQPDQNQDVYGLIFRKGGFIAYCQVRGSMTEPENWRTFKPAEFLSLSDKIPDGKYELGLLPEGTQAAPAFSITVKDHQFVKVQEWSKAATPKTPGEVTRELAKKLVPAKRSAAQSPGKSQDREPER